MDSLVDHSAHYNELVSYFASYLRDMNSIISQVKNLAYTLINVPSPSPKNQIISNDIASVMSACKRTFDDIKRTQSILRGHVKGKEISGSSRLLLSNHNIHTSVSPTKSNELQHDIQAEKIENDGLLRVDSASPSKQFLYGKNELEEQKSTCIANQQKSDVNKKNREQLRNSRAATDQLQERPQQIESKIQNLRLIRNKDLQSFVSENEQCISLIQKIRNQLKIKIK